MLWLYLLIFFVSLVALIKASAWSVKSLAKIAHLLQWSEFVVSFVLMAFVTTLPEFFVGLTAGLNKSSQLAFGNIIGSNLTHLTLVAAIAVFVGNALSSQKAIIQKTALFTALICFLPLALMLDGSLSRIDGLILIAGLALYFYRLLGHKKRFDKTFSGINAKNHVGFKILLKSLGLFSLSVILLMISAQGIVWASLRIAQVVGLSLITLGALILGLGTNLPEITFAIKAAKTGHKSMILGDIMGAVAVNSGLVLGSALLISPLKIANFGPYLAGIIFVIVSVLLFLFFAKTDRKISRKEGIILLAIYIAFVISQLIL